MKKHLFVLLLCLLTVLLTACSCEHEWVEATCEQPKTCTKCGETEGEALPHDWIVASCIAPKTCAHCGLAEGDIAGHAWEEATCIAPKTCKDCGVTEGDISNHSWQEATCTAPETCSVCGETQGEAVAHTPGNVVYGDIDVINVTQAQELRCSVCDAVISTEEIPVEKFYGNDKFLLSVGQFFDRFQSLAAAGSVNIAIEKDRHSGGFNFMYEGEELASVHFYDKDDKANQDMNYSGSEEIVFRFEVSNKNMNNLFPKVSVWMLQSIFPNYSAQKCSQMWADALSGWFMDGGDGIIYNGVMSYYRDEGFNGLSVKF